MLSKPGKTEPGKQPETLADLVEQTVYQVAPDLHSEDGKENIRGLSQAIADLTSPAGLRTLIDELYAGGLFLAFVYGRAKVGAELIHIRITAPDLTGVKHVDSLSRAGMENFAYRHQGISSTWSSQWSTSKDTSTGGGYGRKGGSGGGGYTHSSSESTGLTTKHSDTVTVTRSIGDFSGNDAFDLGTTITVEITRTSVPKRGLNNVYVAMADAMTALFGGVRPTRLVRDTTATLTWRVPKSMTGSTGLVPEGVPVAAGGLTTVGAFMPPKLYYIEGFYAEDLIRVQRKAAVALGQADAAGLAEIKGQALSWFLSSTQLRAHFDRIVSPEGYSVEGLLTPKLLSKILGAHVYSGLTLRGTLLNPSFVRESDSVYIGFYLKHEPLVSSQSSRGVATTRAFGPKGNLETLADQPPIGMDGDLSIALGSAVNLAHAAEMLRSRPETHLKLLGKTWLVRATLRLWMRPHTAATGRMDGGQKSDGQLSEPLDVTVLLHMFRDDAWRIFGLPDQVDEPTLEQPPPLPEPDRAEVRSGYLRRRVARSVVSIANLVAMHAELTRRYQRVRALLVGSGGQGDVLAQLDARWGGYDAALGAAGAAIGTLSTHATIPPGRIDVDAVVPDIYDAVDAVVPDWVATTLTAERYNDIFALAGGVTLYLDVLLQGLNEPVALLRDALREQITRLHGEWSTRLHALHNSAGQAANRAGLPNSVVRDRILAQLTPARTTATSLLDTLTRALPAGVDIDALSIEEVQQQLDNLSRLGEAIVEYEAVLVKVAGAEAGSDGNVVDTAVALFNKIAGYGAGTASPPGSPEHTVLRAELDADADTLLAPLRQRLANAAARWTAANAAAIAVDLPTAAPQPLDRMHLDPTQARRFLAVLTELAQAWQEWIDALAAAEPPGDDAVNAALDSGRKYLDSDKTYLDPNKKYSDPDATYLDPDQRYLAPDLTEALAAYRRARHEFTTVTATTVPVTAATDLLTAQQRRRIVAAAQTLTLARSQLVARLVSVGQANAAWLNQQNLDRWSEPTKAALQQLRGRDDGAVESLDAGIEGAIAKAAAAIKVAVDAWAVLAKDVSTIDNAALGTALDSQHVAGEALLELQQQLGVAETTAQLGLSGPTVQTARYTTSGSAFTVTSADTQGVHNRSQRQSQRLRPRQAPAYTPPQLVMDYETLRTDRLRRRDTQLAANEKAYQDARKSFGLDDVRHDGDCFYIALYKELNASLPPALQLETDRAKNPSQQDIKRLRYALAVEVQNRFDTYENGVDNDGVGAEPDDVVRIFGGGAWGPRTTRDSRRRVQQQHLAIIRTRGDYTATVVPEDGSPGSSQPVRSPWSPPPGCGTYR